MGMCSTSIFGSGNERSFMFIAGVAQLVEQLICNQQVTSSSLVASSRSCRDNQQVAGSPPKGRFTSPKADAPWAQSPIASSVGAGDVKFAEAWDGIFGQVAKRSNATDCKSVGSGLRRFESFPAHKDRLRVRE